MKQKLIDAIVGVLRQGGVSRTKHGNCAYRGGDGRKCVVGHMIPDDKYDPAMDAPERDTSVGANPNVCVAAGFDPNDEQTVCDLVALQEWHDALSERVCDETVEAWRRYAIKQLPGFIDKGAVKDACHKAGVLL